MPDAAIAAGNSTKMALAPGYPVPIQINPALFKYILSHDGRK
jgi:hypothetical protein